jgi:hypothetical protein
MRGVDAESVSEIGYSGGVPVAFGTNDKTLGVDGTEIMRRVGRTVRGTVRGSVR